MAGLPGRSKSRIPFSMRLKKSKKESRLNDGAHSMKSLREAVAFAICVLLTGCAALGSMRNPIECSGPEGEREYLDRLRGPDSLPVIYKRNGSVLGQRRGYVMYDEYSVESQNGAVKKLIYMNMDAGGFEDEPVEGFSIVKE